MAVPAHAPDPPTGIAQNAQQPHDSSYVEAKMALSAIIAKFPTVDFRAFAHVMATDPTQLTSRATTMAQKHSHVEDDHLEGGNYDQPDSPSRSNLDDHAEVCLHRESSQPGIAVASCSTADIPATGNQQSADLASPIAAEMDPVHKQSPTPIDEHPTLVPDSDTNCQHSCLHGASAETAGTTVAEPFSCPPANPQAVDNPGSFTSPETDPVQKKDDAPVEGEPAPDVELDGARLEHPSDIPRAAVPSARRPKAAKTAKSAKSFNTSASRRRSHAARTEKKSGNRAPQDLRAQQHGRLPANTTRLPAELPAADVRHGRDDGKTPNPPRPSAKTKGGNQVPEQFRMPQPPQAIVETRTATRRDRFPNIDMEGVNHVVGGLVEVSLGRKDPLFARQVQGNPSDLYNNVKVVRHNFFPYPPPDMRESNIEFDRELEERRPIFDGFDLDLIDHQVDAYAEQTKFLAERMKEHQAEFDPVIEEFLAIKEELTHLNYERQRAITSEYAIKEVMTPKERRERLAEVAAAEVPLIKRQKILEPHLTELILRSRSKVARGLRQDLRVAGVIDEKKERARQREVIEEKETELGIAGAMIGLQGTLKEQSHTTHTAIMGFTKHVVDERLKAFDDEQKWKKPDYSGPTNRPSNIDTVMVPTVPDWFTILDARGANELYSGPTPMDRFKQLLLVVGALAYSTREDQYDNESRPERHTWNKEYHEPNDAWPKAIQRLKGGWWACRRGPDASFAERSCRLCHRNVPAEHVRASGPSVAERRQHILDEIESAMAEANQRDRFVLKHQLQQEHEDIDRYWQQREWRRSGGGVHISEVLHSRDVNDLNYRPSAGRSKSWQGPNAMAQPQEPLGKQADGDSRDKGGSSQTPQHQAGSF